MKKILWFVLLVGAIGCQVSHNISDLHWQKKLERLLGGEAPPPDDGLCPTNSAIWLEWETRVKLAIVGMSRREVEKILPVCDFPKDGPHPTSRGAAVFKLPSHADWMYEWYYIAPDFIAEFIYEDSGPLRLGSGPDQRLVYPPNLIHHDFTKSGSFYFPPNGKKAVTRNEVAP